VAHLSIIVTTYNIENYVGACLDSILGQSFDDLEIIVVDDGSSDRTPEIVRDYETRDGRVVFVACEENSIGGVATAANLGLDRATSPLVGFADGDDLYEPTMFERLVTAIESTDADLAMCRYQLLDDETGEHRAPAEEGRWARMTSSVVDLTDDGARADVLRFIAVPWRKLYRRELLEDNAIRFPVGDYFWEDNPFHWFSVLSAKRLAVVPEVLCYHRVNRVGQTMQSGDARLLRMFEHHDSIRKFLDHHELTERFGPELLLWTISQLEWISREIPSEQRGELLETLATILDRYPRSVIDSAFHRSDKGQRARDLVAAIQARDLSRFHLAIDGPPRGPRPSARGLVGRFRHHLRSGGPKLALQITGRYLTLRAGGLVDRWSRIRRRRNHVTNDDLMLALVLVEERLLAIERQLGQQPESGDDATGNAER
jgi:glycosyltransferase involved in cell wall biosynthesis